MDRTEHDAAISPLRVTDPALNAYVKSVMCKLSAEQCGDNPRLYSRSTAEFNAATMANGAMVVFTGLLLHSENEAQLAYILGHEMTHFTPQSINSILQMRRAISTSNDRRIFFGRDRRASVWGWSAVQSAELAAVGGLYAYDRGQERDADAGGFDLGTAAGYDPEQAAAHVAGPD